MPSSKMSLEVPTLTPEDSAVASAATLSEEAPSAPRSSTQARGSALRGGLWILFGYGALQALRFVFNLILTRLLMPEIFGLMALINTLITGLQTFSELGIATSVIHHKNGEDPRFLKTVWTFQVLRGLGLWLCTFLLAWPMAAFYDRSSLFYLVPAAGLNAAIAGFNSVSLLLLARKIQRGPLALVNVGCYLAGMLVTLAYVLAGHHDAWSFVIGGLLTTTLTMIVSHFLMPGLQCCRPCWDRPSVQELVGFGKWVLASTICAFLADRADTLIIGKLASLSFLGVYNLSYQLSLIVILLVYAMSTQLVFPAYSRWRQAGKPMSEALHWYHPRLTGLGAVLATGLLAAGPLLIKCLYTVDYQQAEFIIQVLAIVAWLRTLESAGGALLWGIGNARAPAMNNAIKVVTMAVFMPVGYYLVGFLGLLAAIVLSDLVRYLATLYALSRKKLRVLPYDLAFTLCILAIAAAGWMAGKQTVFAHDKWVRLFVCGSVVVALWSPVGLFFWLRSRRGAAPPDRATLA